MSSQARRIDREQVQAMVRDDQALLIEVLSPTAFETLHLPGAINIPLSELDRDQVEQFDRDRPIVVYCYDHQ